MTNDVRTADFGGHEPYAVLVTSASGVNGDGYGAILRFRVDGTLIGPFSRDPRISDPRGLCFDQGRARVYVCSGDDRVLALDLDGKAVLDSGRLDGLDPGGCVFGPDGRLYVGSRRRRTILALPADLGDPRETVLPEGVVPYPRGFAFGPDGSLYLASGVGPSGEGDDTIVVVDPKGGALARPLVDDPELSPLDLVVAPNGNLLVASEWPYGSPAARSTVREYEPTGGSLVRVLTPDPGLEFAKPRGLRVQAPGRLYCVGRDHVIAFDLVGGSYVGVVVTLSRLNGQAVVLAV